MKYKFFCKTFSYFFILLLFLSSLPLSLPSMWKELLTISRTLWYLISHELGNSFTLDCLTAKHPSVLSLEVAFFSFFGTHKSGLGIHYIFRASFPFPDMYNPAVLRFLILSVYQYVCMLACVVFIVHKTVYFIVFISLSWPGHAVYISVE